MLQEKSVALFHSQSNTSALWGHSCFLLSVHVHQTVNRIEQDSLTCNLICSKEPLHDRLVFELTTDSFFFF